MKPKLSSKIPIKLKKDFQFKKRADFAHKAIHRKGLTHTKKHISGRIDSVKNLNTKRLLFSWTAKFVIILGLAILSFSKLNTASRYEGFINGGSVIVGISDENTKLKLNPLTLSSPAELAIGRLIFSSPLKYDKLGKLQGDAVESYTSEDSGKKIRMVLREGMQWHDGKPLTSEDIVFTISSLKIPRVNSSLRDSLAGIEAVAIDPRVLEISSPKPLAGLDDLMTRIRIAPKHLFEGIESDDLASIDYNELPVGSGALEVGSFVATKETSTLGIEGAGTFQQLSLNINNNYYGNKAQADLTLRVFPQKENLQQAFNGGLIEIFVGGGTGTELREGTEEIKLAISSGVFGFYNLNSPNLKDVKMRRALTDYINRQLVSEISGGVKPLYSPVLEVEPAARAMGTVESSQKLITEAGWQFDDARSIFVKDGQDLELNMVTGESDDYIGAAKELVARWKELGVRVNLEIVKSSELQSNYFVNKSYDILLYGISLNEASDPYAYWSSAAATSKGLNFSSYQSAASDADLDVARTKLDPAERRIRLERFVKRWDEDVPAISLYVPSIKVIYNSATSQPEPNQETSINNYADGFEFLTEVKAQKKKIYKTD